MSEREVELGDGASKNGHPPLLECFICGVPVGRLEGVFHQPGVEGARNFGVCDHHLERGPVVGWDQNGRPVLLHYRDEQEEAVSYDSRPETYDHIGKVRANLNVAIENLIHRAHVHDASKLVQPELEAFDIATPKLAELEYGSDEYRQSLRDLGPALQHHFSVNDHHPEHHGELGVRGMSLMALLEMLCDWHAASKRVKQRTDDPERVKTFTDGLAYNQERFGYSDELAEILLNTARELGLT